MLLAKTLRSSTFRVALLCVGVFGAATAVLIIYLSTAADRYLRLRYDGTIAAEERLLQDAYLRQGEAEIARLARLDAGTQTREGSVLLLGDRDYHVLTGTEAAWPEAARLADGWVDFRETRGADGASSLVRAHIASFPDGNRLLVGRRMTELDDFARAIDTGVIAGLALLLVIAGARESWSRGGRLRASRPSMRPAAQSWPAGSASASRCAARGTNGISWRRT